MAINQLATLESLGYLPYWDSELKHPIKETDTLNLEPDQTIDIWYGTKPVQEADGKWYANEVHLYEPFPFYIGGAYSKEEIRTDTYIFSDNDDDKNIHGKVEEFAFWEKAVEDLTIQSYHISKTGMIGTTSSDLYSSVNDAKGNGLRYYYKFNNTLQLAQNFIANTSNIIKSSNFATGGGKNDNANILSNPQDKILLESMRFAQDFTINLRFYMEEEIDFVLFNNPSSLKISYEAINETFIANMIPYIGYPKTIRIETVNIKAHAWYDFALTYRDGTLTAILNGEIKETNNVNLQIGGVERLYLNHTNIESVQVLGCGNAGYGSDRQACRPPDNETKELMDTAWSYNQMYGKKEIQALVFDKVNAKGACASHTVPVRYVLGEFEETDSVAKDGDVYIGRASVVSSPYTSSSDILTRSTSSYATHNRFKCSAPEFVVQSMGSENNLFNLLYHLPYRSEIGYGNWAYLYPFTVGATRNVLVPLAPIRLRLTVKTVISPSEPIFPKLLIIPSTRLKVTKREVIPAPVDIADTETIANSLYYIEDATTQESGTGLKTLYPGSFATSRPSHRIVAVIVK